MGRCRRARSGSLGRGEAETGRGAGMRRQERAARESRSGRPVGGWALAALPPPLQHCPLGAREGKPPAGEGPNGAGPALTDGRAGLWSGARGVGPGGRGGAWRELGGRGARFGEGYGRQQQ